MVIDQTLKDAVLSHLLIKLIKISTKKMNWQ